jgi:hypothetical protein
MFPAKARTFACLMTFSSVTLFALNTHRPTLAAPLPNSSATKGSRALVQPPVSEDNPVVSPGKVRWHASFADARAAARKSGKPVLLFHMMGQLDRQFC